ncbi:hypothetical protein AVEN_56841-1 [Araneus ventricosus]|uniref:Uncharacterized protein n=1 Tax=Araneus ventricosus TaxID=182803 RepID=A0A4Y2A725_ARAVE|nr:hypothetical protein AVEN_56841-1 [Araneus ventricosus]
MTNCWISKRVLASLLGMVIVWSSVTFARMTENISFGIGWAVPGDGYQDSDFSIRAIVAGDLRCFGRTGFQCTMPQNVGLPSPGISKLLQCHLNYSG